MEELGQRPGRNKLIKLVSGRAASYPSPETGRRLNYEITGLIVTVVHGEVFKLANDKSLPGEVLKRVTLEIARIVEER